MNAPEHKEHRLRLEWLSTRRKRECPDCNPKEIPKKQELKMTQWCPLCKQIWLIRKGKWSYENGQPATHP